MHIETLTDENTGLIRKLLLRGNGRIARVALPDMIAAVEAHVQSLGLRVVAGPYLWSHLPDEVKAEDKLLDPKERVYLRVYVG